MSSLPADTCALITGANGQLGRELVASTPPGWQVTACTSRDVDVTRPDVVAEALRRARPAVVIHCAAFTAVDQAEAEPARAEAVNADGAAHVAEAARGVGARLIHVSTDFVFDGGLGRPYGPGDAPSPLSVYGHTKLAGERAVERVTEGTALIVRTAWLYGRHGRNFVRTMLRLMREGEALAVVADQVGTPTSARSLAAALWACAARPDLRGVHHWTDAGVASRYDFAVAIQEEALRAGVLAREVSIRPVRTEDCPTPARRPGFCVLDKTATWSALELPVQHWRANLRTSLPALGGHIAPGRPYSNEG